ncbi:hypothetical protein AGMMS4952_03070 [Spirochaetia bacterium]|nr:hypothetical protein AGMMS4952_03070 [Spirochaetia bacterium]
MTDSIMPNDELLPFESWERLAKESSAAFAAFGFYRDFGPERNMSRAVKAAETDPVKAAKRYRMWRLWSAQFQWRERAAAYDQFLDQIKLAGRRRALEAQEAANLEALKKLMATGSKALDMIDPAQMAHGTTRDFIETGIRLTREGVDKGSNQNGDDGAQPLLSFASEFEGL